MTNQRTIICTFCQGTGNNPHFKGTCPVCKGRGKNEVIGKYIACGDCRGSGQKGGTTLTCYTCAGLGVIPDTRETFRKAREEIGEAREEMKKEKEEFRKKPDDGCFCQSCAKKVNRESTLKVCFACFRKIKKI